MQIECGFLFGTQCYKWYVDELIVFVFAGYEQAHYPNADVYEKGIWILKYQWASIQLIFEQISVQNFPA